ncbi:MAG: acyl carrier protein [Anaerolineales bacterium]|nr:acyl carrier protein [Anaerolineales bacterium]
MSTSSILAEYITRELAKGRTTTVGVDEDLLGTGVIDSLGVLQLVSFVDERFGFQIPDEDVVIENFQSISALADYLDQHRHR